MLAVGGSIFIKRAGVHLFQPFQESDFVSQHTHQNSVGYSPDDEAIKAQYYGDRGNKGEEEVEEWREQKIEISKLPGMYLRLSKHKLTSKCM